MTLMWVYCLEQIWLGFLLYVVSKIFPPFLNEKKNLFVFFNIIPVSSRFAVQQSSLVVLKMNTLSYFKIEPLYVSTPE